MAVVSTKNPTYKALIDATHRIGELEARLAAYSYPPEYYVSQTATITRLVTAHKLALRDVKQLQAELDALHAKYPNLNLDPK